MKIIIACLLAFGSLFAQSTYSYTGNNFVSPSGLAPVNDHLSISFVLQYPIPPNSNNLTISPNQWTMTDSVSILTQSTGNLSANVTTDSSGNITSWNIKSWTSNTWFYSCGGINCTDIADVSESAYYIKSNSDPEILTYGFTLISGTWKNKIGPTTQNYPTIYSIKNATGYGMPAPGGAASIYGYFPNISTATPTGDSLPATFDNVTVTINGFKTPIYYISSTQINVQIPWEVVATYSSYGYNSSSALINTLIEVSTDTWTTTQTTEISSVSPSLFELDPNTHQGAILNEKNNIVSSSFPAVPGSVIQIYGTGLGFVTNQTDGEPAPNAPLATTFYPTTVLIDGINSQVLFSGLTPGSVGLYQINAVVPSGLVPNNATPVTISVVGVISNTVTIAVQ